MVATMIAILYAHIYKGYLLLFLESQKSQVRLPVLRKPKGTKNFHYKSFKITGKQIPPLFSSVWTKCTGYLAGVIVSVYLVRNLNTEWNFPIFTFALSANMQIDEQSTACI